MWSAADLWYADDLSVLAFELWKKIASSWYTLVYWAEKDSDSLSASSARWAKSCWWTTVWITYGKDSQLWWDMNEYTDIIICTGMERWWWREFVLVSSCDAIITIGWWSGTLNEITIAYQKKIPIVCIQWTWWWSDRLSDIYIDERYIIDSSRFICKWVTTVKDAIDYLSQLNTSTTPF